MMHYFEIEKTRYFTRSNSHRMLFGYLPDSYDGERPFTFKFDDDRVYVLSKIDPVCKSINIINGLQETVYQFGIDLACYKRHVDAKEEDRTFISDFDGARAYLDERMERDGMKMRYAHSCTIDEIYIGYKDVAFSHHKFLGTLEINNKKEAMKRIVTGYGRGKCWGLGMIHLPEVMKV